jgi:hypothetical protein
MGQIEILAHAELIDQVVVLEDESDFFPLQLLALLGIQRFHRDAIQAIAALPVVIHEAEHIEQRALARPRRPHHAD